MYTINSLIRDVEITAYQGMMYTTKTDISGLKNDVSG
jgi:hypothetical protein